MEQVRRENRRKARRDAGLAEEGIDIKNRAADPTVSYIEEPKHHSRAEYLLSVRRRRVSVCDKFAR